MKRLTQEEAIAKLIQKRGNKYDYPNFCYRGNNVYIQIKCLKHNNIFWQTYSNHVHQMCDCPKCAQEIISKNQRRKVSDFVDMSNSVHNFEYDYSLITDENYKNNKTKIPIKHKKCLKVFWMCFQAHIQQQNKCPYCYGSLVQNTEDFIRESKRVHGENEFEYSKTIFTKWNNKVIVIHKICKKEIEVKPQNHLYNETGCPQCLASQGNKKIYKILSENNIEFNQEHRFCDCRDKYPLPFDCYIHLLNMCIEYDGIQHLKAIKRFGGEEGLQKIQKHDKIKTEYCLNNNIGLLRIPYILKKKEHIKEQLKEIITKYNSLRGIYV